MPTMLIAQNETRESGSFMGDQLCSLKTAYLFAENTDADHFIMSVSPGNEMHFLWEKFIQKYNVELVYDNWNPGDWSSRWNAWDKWRTERHIEDRPFDYYRELYLRIHGSQRQKVLCGSECGLGHTIYDYWWYGQENVPDEPPKDAEEWNNHGVLTSYSFDDTLVDTPPLTPRRDVYISPHAKTQGNIVFTFDFWARVVHTLIESGISVTVGYDGNFCEELNNHPLYRKHWGDHREWMEQVCQHKLVACGNTGTGWLAAACGVPMITMEPPGSQMPDHRYRECGLRNIVELVDKPDADYVANRIVEEIQRCVVMTTGCYDIIHAGHIRHLERSKALGTKLIVALNSDSSIKGLKGEERPINPQNQRKAVLEALKCVDEVRIFDGPNALDLIEEIKPNILTNGFGYKPEDVVGRDLMAEWEGRVVITCQGDAKDEPSTTKIVKKVRAVDIVETCRIGANSSVNPFEKLKLMADHMLSVRNLLGDMADLGACRGGTSYILRKLAPEKELHVFDTWEGTPYDDPLCHHKKGEWRAQFKECKRLVGESELTHYYKGVFPESVNGVGTLRFGGLSKDGPSFCFVYVDMDTEQATKDAIEFFWPRMVSGGKIFIDDFGWTPCAGVQAAVDSLMAARLFEERDRHIILPLYTCILEKP